MKRFIVLAPLLFALAAQAQVDSNPSTIDIVVGPGSTVTDTVRTNSKTRNVSITRNPNDVVHLTHPVVMNSGRKVDLSTAPPPDAGSGELRVKDTTEEPVPSTSGAFRTVATRAWTADVDLLVYPGQPGKSHTHAGYCNKNGGDAFQTAETLFAAGDSTCRGGIANRSSYWFGILLDDVTSKPFFADQFSVYYKGGAFTQARGYGWLGPDGVWHPSATPWPGFSDLPTGLRFVMGNPMRQTPYKSGETFDYRWKCGATFYTQIPQDPIACPVGATLIQELFAGQCWDGQNLDSPDHKSHLAYPVNVRNKLPDGKPDPRGWSHAECPSTHPKVLPHISFQIMYTVTTDIRRYRLVTDVDSTKPPGIGSHGDVVVAWNPKIAKMFVENCIRAQKDCHTHLLGRDPDDGKLKAIY